MTGNHVRGDGFEMYPDDTRRLMTVLRAAGDTLAGKWQTAHNEIMSHQNLGKGPLGEKFLSQYNGFRDSLVKAMDGAAGAAGVSKIYQEYAAAGERSASKYEATDAQSAGRFRG